MPLELISADAGTISAPGSSTIFIYDAFEGGIGISKKLYEIFPALNQATIGMIKECGCETGCPSCVYSPRCGNNNSPIDKAGAIELMKRLV